MVNCKGLRHCRIIICCCCCCRRRSSRIKIRIEYTWNIIYFSKFCIVVESIISRDARWIQLAVDSSRTRWIDNRICWCWHAGSTENRNDRSSWRRLSSRSDRTSCRNANWFRSRCCRTRACSSQLTRRTRHRLIQSIRQTTRQNYSTKQILSNFPLKFDLRNQS